MHGKQLCLQNMRHSHPDLDMKLRFAYLVSHPSSVTDRRTYACVVDSLLWQHTKIPSRLLHDFNKHAGSTYLLQDPNPQASHHWENHLAAGAQGQTTIPASGVL